MSNDLPTGIAIGASVAAMVIVFAQPSTWAAGISETLTGWGTLALAAAAAGTILDNNRREKRSARRESQRLFSVAFHEATIVSGRVAQFCSLIADSQQKSENGAIESSKVKTARGITMPPRNSLIPQIVADLGLLGSRGPDHLLLMHRIGVEDFEARVTFLLARWTGLSKSHVDMLVSQATKAVLHATIAQIAMAVELQLKNIGVSTATAVSELARLRGMEKSEEPAAAFLALLKDQSMYDENQDWAEYVANNKVYFG